LPEAQRETVFLVYVEGLTYREAADLLGVPIGTVMRPRRWSSGMIRCRLVAAALPAALEMAPPTPDNPSCKRMIEPGLTRSST
ncbi:MAG: hypothetical protein J0J14_12645, partial [Hyphomicrobium sp.]|nr:hypothetical protein [Hyphomicrobium sp.]